MPLMSADKGDRLSMSSPTSTSEQQPAGAKPPSSSKRLIAHADREAEEVRMKMEALFASDGMPIPLTVHLYQPVPIHVDAKHPYRLLDVATKARQEGYKFGGAS